MESNAILIRNALLIDGVRKEPVEGVSVLIVNKKIKGMLRKRVIVSLSSAKFEKVYDK